MLFFSTMYYSLSWDNRVFGIRGMDFERRFQLEEEVEQVASRGGSVDRDR